MGTDVNLGQMEAYLLSESFKSRDYIQKEKHGPYFEVSAIRHDLVMKTREKHPVIS